MAFSAPTLPYETKSTAGATNMAVLSEYFSLLGSKVQAGKDSAAPVCDLSNAVMPTACRFFLFNVLEAHRS